MTKNNSLLKFQWVVIAFFLIFIVLLIIQNFSLKSRYIPPKVIQQKTWTMSLMVKMEEEFLFKKCPISLEPTEFFFNAEYPMTFVRHNLVIVFDFTVCAQCLKTQLQIINTYREQLADKSIRILAIIGIASKREESDIINFKKNGGIFFPCKIIPVEQLYQIFNLSKDRFLDTPFYLFTSHESIIQSVFKPEFQEIDKFIRWIEIFSRMDII